VKSVLFHFASRCFLAHGAVANACPRSGIRETRIFSYDGLAPAPHGAIVSEIPRVLLVVKLGFIVEGADYRSRPCERRERLPRAVEQCRVN